MRARSVSVIVPLGRDRFLGHVLECFIAQRETCKRLIVVENGEAIGACARVGVIPDVLLTSETGAAWIPKNVGLQWVRDHGGGFVSIWDDDDLYCPELLGELLECSDRSELLGKSAGYVQTAAGSMRLFVNHGEHREVRGVQGPCMSGFAEALPDFPAASPNEDGKLCRMVCEAGGRIYATSRFHFLYRRFPPDEHAHEWRITDWQMAQLSNADVFDVGPVDLEVVQGCKPEPERVLVPKRPMRPWFHPGWQAPGGKAQGATWQKSNP